MRVQKRRVCASGPISYQPGVTIESAGASHVPSASQDASLVGSQSLVKRALMYAYGEGWISFEVCERIASWLRRFQWFREG